MADQTEFNCVSCETTFDPAPNGGFCPDCNTPHPDYDAPNDADGTEEDSDEDDSDTIERITDASGSEAVERITDADDALEGDDAGDDTSEPETGVDDGSDEADVDDGAETDADGDGAEADEPGTIECQSCNSAVDASAAFCPSCGTELEDDQADESEDDESVELTACPDCGNSVDDESFCPNCGTDLDAVREGGDADDAADDSATTDDATDDVPAEVTLEIDGEEYTFGDGDVFGRRDEEWLADLVSASGGREEARYISSEHLEFSVEDDGVYVTDVSTNGTKHNGTAMDGSEAKLEDGDTLELADRATLDVHL